MKPSYAITVRQQDRLSEIEVEPTRVVRFTLGPSRYVDVSLVDGQLHVVTPSDMLSIDPISERILRVSHVRYRDREKIRMERHDENYAEKS